MEATSRDLELKAIEGDQAALSKLIQLHDAVLRQRLRGQIPPRWQAVLSADDLLQETYTDAFLGIRDFRSGGDGSFPAWLTAIAKHNLLSAIQSLQAEKRGGKRRRIDPVQQEESFVALYELLGGSATTPSRLAARHEARAALEEAIERLPEDHQRVVRMYDLEGCPVDDVAAAMQRSPGAVFMVRARAHHTLRTLLGAPLQYFTDFA